MKIPKRIIENEIGAKDVEILNRLTDAEFFHEFEEEIVRKLAAECVISVEEAEARFKTLKEKEIVKGFSAQVDQLKIWDYKVFTFVKVSLSPPLVEEDIAGRYPSSWVDIGELLRKFVEEDDLAKKILREAYTLVGTEWDVLLVTNTNDLSEWREMLERLIRKGFVSMAWSVLPLEGAPYIFRPISCPSSEEVKSALEEIKKRLTKD